MTKIRAFILLEVLIAMVISVLILTGSVSMAKNYAEDLLWQRLETAFSGEIFHVKNLALAGASAGEDLPDMYHLYFEGEEIWYLESRDKEYEEILGSGHNRVINYSRQIIWDLPVIVLKEISMIGETRTKRGSSVLLSWSDPYALMSFQLLEIRVEEGSFAFIEEDQCWEEDCQLVFLYEKPGAGNKKIILDNYANDTFFN